MESAKNQNLGPTSGSLISMTTFSFQICGLVNVNVSKLETSFLCRKLFMKCKSKTGRSTCSSTCHICLVQRPICWKPLNPPRPSITFSVSFRSPRQAKQQQCAIWTVRHSSWTLPSFLRHNSPSCPLRPLSCTDIGFVWPFHLDFPPHVCFRFLFLWCYISMLFEIWSSMQHIRTFQMCMEPL